MTVATRLPETAVAAPVVAWLDGMWDDVYQEIKADGYIADIVATRRYKHALLVAVIEAKTRLNFDVIAQALRWKWCANYAWVATPGLHGRPRDAAILALRSLGLGWLTVSPYPAPLVQEAVAPALRRRVTPEIMLAALRPEQKTYVPAGSPGGKSWTPWRATCHAVAEMVRQHPEGIPLRDVINRTDHHYSRSSVARACIARDAELGRIEGVELRRIGYAVTLHAKGAA